MTERRDVPPPVVVRSSEATRPDRRRLPSQGVVMLWGGVAAATAIVATTVIPWLLGSSTYDPMVALTLIMTLAIIATAVYGAQNLAELRAARQADHTPVLDLHVRWGLGSTIRRGEMDVEIWSASRAPAFNLEGFLWWMDADQVSWLPHRLERLPYALREGETARAEIEAPWLRFPIQRHDAPELPAMILEVRYRDGLRREVIEYATFDYVDEGRQGSPAFRRSSKAVPDQLTSLEGKRLILSQALERMALAYDLESHGLEITSTVDRDKMVAYVKAPDEDDPIWFAQDGTDQGIHRVLEAVERRLQETLGDALEAGGEGAEDNEAAPDIDGDGAGDKPGDKPHG